MFPRTRQSRHNEEEDQDRMASRLQLDLGRDAMARQAAKSGGSAAGSVDVFRGVSFDDWLRIFMQVWINV